MAEPLQLAVDDAVYLVSVFGRGRTFPATVVCDINAFDQAAELACAAVALDTGFPVDELYAVEVTMLTRPLIIAL